MPADQLLLHQEPKGISHVKSWFICVKQNFVFHHLKWSFEVNSFSYVTVIWIIMTVQDLEICMSVSSYNYQLTQTHTHTHTHTQQQQQQQQH